LRRRRRVVVIVIEATGEVCHRLRVRALLHQTAAARARRRRRCRHGSRGGRSCRCTRRGCWTGKHSCSSISVAAPAGRRRRQPTGGLPGWVVGYYRSDVLHGSLLLAQALAVSPNLPFGDNGRVYGGIGPRKWAVALHSLLVEPKQRQELRLWVLRDEEHENRDNTRKNGTRDHSDYWHAE